MVMIIPLQRQGIMFFEMPTFVLKHFLSYPLGIT
jgi:hypothetical protein